MFHLCNWYHLAAILAALPITRFDESTSPNLFGLLLPKGNYAVFRARMKAQPGLPFLPPYQRQYTIDGKATLSEVFTFASYDLEIMAQYGSSTRGNGILPYFLRCITG